MNVIIQQKLNSYLALLEEIKEKTGDEETARVLLGEVAQDLRMEQIHEERSFNGNVPATDNQIGYLRRLGAEIPEGLTKKQASKLIEATLAGKKQGINIIEAPIRIP